MKVLSRQFVCNLDRLRISLRQFVQVLHIRLSCDVYVTRPLRLQRRELSWKLLWEPQASGITLHLHVCRHTSDWFCCTDAEAKLASTAAELEARSASLRALEASFASEQAAHAGTRAAVGEAEAVVARLDAALSAAEAGRGRAEADLQVRTLAVFGSVFETKCLVNYWQDLLVVASMLLLSQSTTAALEAEREARAALEASLAGLASAHTALQVGRAVIGLLFVLGILLPMLVC
jgi:hypothetical protein